MSYGLTLYRVDLERVGKACGSGDAALREAIGERFGSDIAEPIDIPTPDDFPSFGHWSAELVREARSALAGAAVPTKLDDSIREAVAAVLGWLEQAAPRGEAIVGFYY